MNNLLRTTTRFAIRKLTIRPVSTFAAGDNWKDRD